MNEDARWLRWWNIGLLIGFVGLPAMLGFFSGSSIEATARTQLPWRLLLSALGALVGGFAAWRTLMPKRSGERE